jgi:hypothetical protein
MKEKLFYTAKYLIYIAAICQLAMSQVHISVITKVFEPTAGFYLFLFTIFGLVMAFNTTAVKKGSRIELFILGCLAASALGVMYLKIIFQDIQTGKLLTFSDARLSIIFSVATILIFLLSTAVMLITGNFNEEH